MFKVSHARCDLSGVTYQVSCVTCYMSEKVTANFIIDASSGVMGNFCWCQVSHDRCYMSCVRCQVSPATDLVSFVRCLVSCVISQLSEKAQVSGVRCQVSGVRCQVSGVRSLTCHLSLTTTATSMTLSLANSLTMRRKLVCEDLTNQN